MKKKFVMMALVLTVAFCGCGNAATQEAQETTAQAADESQSETETAEAEKDVAQAEAEKDVAQADAEKKESAESAAEVAAEENKEAEKAEDEETTAEDKDAKNESGAEADVNAEALEKAEQPQSPEYTVTALAEAKVMYASNAVNVRKGPTTDFERVGGLGLGQEVSVTGQADTGWYEIVYGEEKAFVSNHYLQEEKPAEPAPQATDGAVQAVTEVKNVAGVILVGDSRFVQMQENVGANSCTWIAENGKGYNWLNETAMSRIDGCVGKGSKILINLGVNDPEYVNKYLELINAKSAEWVSKGAKVYYASVNPVWTNPYTTEDEVHNFNTQMQSGLSGNVHWIDSHTYLESIGFKLVDGLHYNAETYQNIFAYYMSCL